VLDADQAVAQAYQRPDVLAAIRQWWTDAVFDPAGRPDRPAIARIVFSDPDQRKRLEALLHPIVLATWEAAMAQAAGDPAVLAFIWDAPLLLEARLTDRCDALVFVECPRKVRLARVAQQRGWDSKELIRREKSQMPLDKKRQMSDDTVRNDADADQVRIQVRQVLTRILATTRDAARQAGVVANGL
jgi:dephospho-CoA kinase